MRADLRSRSEEALEEDDEPPRLEQQEEHEQDPVGKHRELGSRQSPTAAEVGVGLDERDVSAKAIEELGERADDEGPEHWPERGCDPADDQDREVLQAELEIELVGLDVLDH